MLAVHGNDLHAALRRAGHDDGAGADQRLLVGQRDALAGVDGGKRRQQPDGTGYRRDDAVRLRQRGGLQKPLRAGDDARRRVRQGDAQRFGGGFVINGGKTRPELPRLLFQQRHAALRGDGGHRDAQMRRSGQALPADAAGRAENTQGCNHSFIS